MKGLSSVLNCLTRSDLVEAKLQRSLFRGTLEQEDISNLALIAMAGLSAESWQYEDVQGQTADLQDLQTLFSRCSSPISDRDQQNLTRWAVLRNVQLLKQYKVSFECVVDVALKLARR